MKFDFSMTRPCFVGTIMTPRGLAWLKAADLPADLIEVRVDALRAAGMEVGEIAAALRSRRHPVLGTFRIPAEGGRYFWKAAEREAWVLRLLPQMEAVDLELAAVVSLKNVVVETRRRKKKLVLSAHTIDRPASPATLRAWRRGFSRWKPDVRKIAARVGSPRDLQRLALVLIEEPHQPWAVMGVGPDAEVSRRVLSALGSRLVYGYLDRPAAPGQPSVKALRRMLA